MNNASYKILIVFFCFALISCNSKTQSSLPTDINIPRENTDTLIKLKDSPISQNSHKNNELLILDLVNLSNSEIVFKKDFGIKIFTKNEGTWVNILNNFSYPEQENSLPTEQDFPLGQSLGCQPFIKNLSLPTEVTIFVFGNVKDTSGDLVAAHIDIVLVP